LLIVPLNIFSIGGESDVECDRILLLICWWPMFAAVFKGILPILLILIGLGVLIYYISEIKSKLGLKKEDTPAETK